MADATARLKKSGVEAPSFEARLLIEHALDLNRADLLSQSERILSDEEIRRIENLIARRAAHEPVARIIGEREFWSLNFGLNEATLEPRPDSEALVEVAIENLRDKIAPRILDLGTGTGCLLLSILHEIPSATGIGIDIAPRAIEQARMNAEKLGLTPRADFRIGDWLDDITEKFDAIIANPPYIPSPDIAGLMPEVREHDPLRALDGGKDGLDIYRHLIPHIPHFLKSGGFTLFEVGIGQADDVAGLCRNAGLVDVSKHRDLNGIERCVAALRSKRS